MPRRKPVSDLPEPRPDGLCTLCSEKPAVTKDGLFCRKCLGKVLSEDAPIRDLNRKGTEDIGRPARSTRPLGGEPF